MSSEVGIVAGSIISGMILCAILVPLGNKGDVEALQNKVQQMELKESYRANQEAYNKNQERFVRAQKEFDRIDRGGGSPFKK
jgi:hypothetical protein